MHICTNVHLGGIHALKFIYIYICPQAQFQTCVCMFIYTDIHVWHVHAPKWIMHKACMYVCIHVPMYICGTYMLPSESCRSCAHRYRAHTEPCTLRATQSESTLHNSAHYVAIPRLVLSQGFPCWCCICVHIVVCVSARIMHTWALCVHVSSASEHCHTHRTSHLYTKAQVTWLLHD